MGSIFRAANCTQYSKEIGEKNRECQILGGKQGTDAFIVKLTKRTCSCKSWELSSLLCSHTIAVIKEERLNPMSLFHDCYSTDYLKITYSHILRPINGNDMWGTNPSKVIIVLYFKPKKKTTCKFKRRPEVGENTKGSTNGIVRKDGVKMHCSNCGGEGYHMTTYTKGHPSLR